MVFVLTDQLYVRTKHSMDDIIARHTQMLRIKYVSYLEVGLQKRKNVFHAQCSYWRDVDFRKRLRSIINSLLFSD